MFELSATQKQLQATAREFAKKEIAPRAAEIDRSEQYPWENVDLLTKQGFMGMTVPQKYGGPGMSYLDVVLVIEEIAKACGVSARIVVEANMGAVGAVMKYGSEVQKKLAAEHVLSGDKPAICIPRHTFQWHVPGISGRTKYLQCVIGDFDRHFRGKNLGLRRFQHVRKTRNVRCDLSRTTGT